MIYHVMGSCQGCQMVNATWKLGLQLCYIQLMNINEKSSYWRDVVASEAFSPKMR